MTGILCDIAKFLWRRDSDSASCLIIGLMSFVNDFDVRNMADYFESVLRYRHTIRAKQRD